MNKIRLLATISACNALSPLALQIVVPALPVIRIFFDTSLSETQVLLSSYSVTLAFAILVYGPMADRFDPKKILVFGMLVFGVGSLIGMYSNSFEFLVLSRIMQAIGAAAGSTLSRVIAAEVYQGDNLNKAMSHMMIVVVVGPMIAPIIGGYLVDNSNWQHIFGILTGLGLLMALAVATSLESSPRGSAKNSAQRGVFQDFAVVISKKGFALNMGILVAVQIGVYAFISASPYLVIEILGFSAVQYGLVFIYLTAGYIVGNVISGQVVAKIGAEKLVMIAAGNYCIGVIIFGGFHVLGVVNLYSIVGPAFLWTLTNGITQPNCGAGALASAKELKGSAASLSGFGQIMAGALGFQLIGMFKDVSTSYLVWILGICGILSWLMAYVLSQNARKTILEDS